MKTLHEKNLKLAREYLRVYKEKQATKLFKGTHLRYFTKEELIKILDIFYITYIKERSINRDEKTNKP